MKITLVNPVVSKDYNRFLSRIYHIKSVTLPYIASLIPPGHDVEIIDEAIANVDFDTNTDLVGITALTLTANRAYAIADEFRKRGKKVVMGGPHVSAVPEEAIVHCDSVAIGNAETIMSRIVSDAENGSLKNFYFNDIPERIPKNIVGAAKGNWMSSLLASRGCELNCSFCTMQNIFGDFYHQRNLEAVKKEIEQITSPYIAFIDDNFYGVRTAARSYYEALMETTAEKGKKWMAQVRLPALSSDKVLEKFSQNNCAYVLIGFESINSSNTRAIAKQKIDKDRYFRAIEKIRSYGIGIIGYFIFGFDDDTRDTIDETVQFCIDSKLELASFCALTPYPGTEIYRQMLSSHRIISFDWDDYDLSKVVFQPKNFTSAELEERIREGTRRFYSASSIWKRMEFHKNYHTISQYIVPNVFRRIGMIGLK